MSLQLLLNKRVQPFLHNIFIRNGPVYHFWTRDNVSYIVNCSKPLVKVIEHRINATGTAEYL